MNSEKEKRQALAYQVNETVKKAFLEALLAEDENAQRARDYLKEYGLDKATAESFGIGYAPSNEQWLAKKLSGQKEAIDVSVKLGLLRQDGTSLFCDRLIFPIHDSQGKVAGFAARTIDNGNPLYLNSSNSLVFQKSRHLYGIYENQQTICQEKKVIIVEDYLDVMTLHQKGIRNVVGLCGTALSIQHAKELSGLVGSCVLCLDTAEGNSHGVQPATIRLFSEGLFVKVAVPLNDGAPALSVDQKSLEFLEHTRSPIDFIYDQFTSATHDPNDPEWLESTAEALCGMLAHLPADRGIVIDGYVRQVEDKLNVSRDALISMIERIRKKINPETDQRGKKKSKDKKSINDAEELKAIVSSRNLLLAWRKVKCFAHTRDVYFDSKLFEQFEKRIDEYLFVLQRQLERHVADYEPYMPNPFRLLRLHKPQGGVRDIAIPSQIEDRIVIQAILNVIAPAIEKTFSTNSFGHRLSTNFTENEMIFERWQNLYGKYQGKLQLFLCAPQSYHFLKADISTFYDRIIRRQLRRKIGEFVQSDWTISTIDNFVNYRLLQHDGVITESGPDGMPQGPAYGHFFANLYLAEFDRIVEKTIAEEQGIISLENLPFWDEADEFLQKLYRRRAPRTPKKRVKNLGYCRYVDDMFILFRSKEEAERGREALAERLGRIGLSFSEEKTEIHPVTDRQVIIDEMKSRKYTLGKLLDNDENLSIDQRETLYDAVEKAFLRIESTTEMADLAKNIPYLVRYLSETEYFDQKKDDLINLVIELLFSESFKHSSIGGVLKRTLPEIIKTRWAKSFAEHLRSPATPDFKRILFMQSVEENNFYHDFDSDLQECVQEFLSSPTDFVRFAAANCLWSNNVDLGYRKTRALILQEKNSQIQARLLHLAGKNCAHRRLPTFLGRQASQKDERAYHALLLAQNSISDAAREVISGGRIENGPAFVELLYAILRNGSREAVERLGKLCADQGSRQLVTELLQIILSHVYQLYDDGFIDTPSVVALSRNLPFLHNERIKTAILQGVVKPLAARIEKEETDLELRDEFREIEKTFINTEHDVARDFIRVIAKGAEVVDIGFLNDIGVSYQAYRHPRSDALDLFETIEERYVTNTGNFSDVYDWLEFIQNAFDDELVWFTNTKVYKDSFGVQKVLIHYHLDSTRIRVCDLLARRHVGEPELAFFMTNIAEISYKLGSPSQKAPTISPYNIIVDASLKPLFINLGTMFCKPRYVSTALANHPDFSSRHDSLFLGWLSFEMLTKTCPLNEIKNIPQTDGRRKFLTNSSKLDWASLFYTRILRRLTYENEDYRAVLDDQADHMLLSFYMDDLQTIKRCKEQGLSGEKILNISLLLFWQHRISDAWSDPNIENQGDAVRMVSSYTRLMENTTAFQQTKDFCFIHDFEFEEPLRAGMHIGSASLDGLLNQVEDLQSQCEGYSFSNNDDRRMNLVVMYLALRIELIARAYVVRAKYLPSWSETSMAKEFVNAEYKAKFLIKHLAIASGISLDADWWYGQMEFLASDIIVMLDENVQSECFKKTGLSGLIAFILLCIDEKDRSPNMKGELKKIHDWEKYVASILRDNKSLSDMEYVKLKDRYRRILKNIVKAPGRRVKAKFKDDLMHWITKNAKVVFDEDGGEGIVKIDDMVCVTNNVFEKQRKKGEIVTCDLIDGNVVALSAMGHYEQKLLQGKPEDRQKDDRTKQEIITQGDHGVVITHANAPVNVNIEKVYIQSPKEISGISQNSPLKLANEKLLEPSNVE